jgi:hypothetical protein
MFGGELLSIVELICNDKNDLNFNISTTLGLKKYEIVSNAFHSSKTFQQSLELAPISLKYLIKKFLCQNYSIFNNSCIVELKITKPPQCSPTHQGLSNGTKSMVRGTMVWEISM